MQPDSKMTLFMRENPPHARELVVIFVAHNQVITIVPGYIVGFRNPSISNFSDDHLLETTQVG